MVDGEPLPPWVTVAVTAFVSPEAALEVLEAIRQAPNDLPTSIPLPRGERTLTDDPAVPGADATAAYRAVLDAENPDAAPDSAGVAFVIGNWLVTVDVQGGLAADAALSAAVDLATQQAACLTAGGSCDTVTLPAEIVEAGAGI
jgi:hypothetical protein